MIFTDEGEEFYQLVSYFNVSDIYSDLSVVQTEFRNSGGKEDWLISQIEKSEIDFNNRESLSNEVILLITCDLETDSGR